MAFSVIYRNTALFSPDAALLEWENCVKSHYIILGEYHTNFQINMSQIRCAWLQTLDRLYLFPMSIGDSSIGRNIPARGDLLCIPKVLSINIIGPVTLRLILCNFESRSTNVNQSKSNRTQWILLIYAYIYMLILSNMFLTLKALLHINAYICSTHFMVPPVRNDSSPRSLQCPRSERICGVSSWHWTGWLPVGCWLLRHGWLRLVGLARWCWLRIWLHLVTNLVTNLVTATVDACRWFVSGPSAFNYEDEKKAFVPSGCQFYPVVMVSHERCWWLSSQYTSPNSAQVVFG